MELSAMSDAEIVNFWGAENLKRWAEKNLRALNIPQSSKLFLMEVGFPWNEHWGFRIERETEELPSLPNNRNLRRICFFGHGASICLDEEQGGSVLWVSGPKLTRQSYVNSDVRSFAQFLVLCEGFARTGQTVPKKDYMDYAHMMVPMIEERMRKIDPKALEDEESLWSITIEQMEDGLL
jgi:hypothetical protein